MNLTPSTMAVVAWILLALLMGALWLWQRRSGNAGIVDVGWTYGVGLASVWFSALGAGWLPRRIVIAALTAIWSLRLGTFLLRDRVIGRPEDGRYRQLRADWGTSADTRFFWFFQAQALAALFFALPAFLIASDRASSRSWMEIVGVGLWCVAFVGESLADRQLIRFKARPSSRGRTCQEGLWRYSRHPNYFFEWLIWVAYALMASTSPFGALAFLCPAVLLYLLFKVTGIPATEAQALRTRGDEYRRYQQTTSAFVPWFRHS